MQTTMNNHSRRWNDDAIRRALEDSGMADGGGNVMQIGIRNEAGQIYRTVTTTGLGDFMGCVNALLEIGLVDELADSTSTREGFDAIFS